MTVFTGISPVSVELAGNGAVAMDIADNIRVAGRIMTIRSSTARGPSEVCRCMSAVVG